MTISLISLDMAGTTIDEGGIVYDVLQATIEDAVGAPIPADVLDRWTGTDKHKAVVGLLGELGAESVDADELYVEFARSLDEAYATATVSIVPGVRDAVARLRADGVKVALQTGYTRAVAESLLASVGWQVGRDIDALATSDEVEASRPAPYMIFRNMADTGVVDVRRVLVAGDTPNDLGAGMNAGARMVVGVLSGASSAATLGRNPHTYLLGSVAEIPQVLAEAGELPTMH
jgi:phosphonatase-like hydrolase